MFLPSFESFAQISATVVVLPVPGPPVIIVILFLIF